MKVVMNIVVIGCIIQILIRSSHGLLNASTPKPTSLKPTSSEYQWVKYTPELWNDTRLVHTIPSNYYIITRLTYSNGDKVPYEGKIYLHKRTMEPFPEMKTNNYEQFEVLLVKPGHYKWIQSSNGTVEKNAIEGGKIGNETIYICRIYNAVAGVVIIHHVYLELIEYKKYE
ncbi:hypothetical protein PV327_007394 [Microctonus hyperodae]|uniref:Uncharacterized protein n=1 Tax=Microctonus hyperodae TaxID=165561 RepID=A0AA39KYE7_MICHY|nr:hypothetical protein PV327_007394 [Microctonus hyperodae]